MRKNDFAFSRRTGLVVIMLVIVALAGCSSLQDMLKPTTVEQVNYKPVAKPEWKDKTIYIDFDTNYGIWDNLYASDLSLNIKDDLIESVVEDKIFHVQDKMTTAKYLYKIEVRIANPVITTNSSGVIQSISATFRIKSYDVKGNLVIAKTREVRYDAPMLTVTTTNSQQTLIKNYIHNASQGIRETMYESLK